MDYQFKSILRGEHSIYEQVRAQGVDPTSKLLSDTFGEYLQSQNISLYSTCDHTTGLTQPQR
jgi:phospholipase D1/2